MMDLTADVNYDGGPVALTEMRCRSESRFRNYTKIGTAVG